MKFLKLFSSLLVSLMTLCLNAEERPYARAREIADILLEMFHQGELSKIFIIYTDMKGAINSETRSTRLLPFHRAQFIVPDSHEKKITVPFEFVPSIETVLDNIVPSYVAGFIYSALIDSFCSFVSTTIYTFIPCFLLPLINKNSTSYKSKDNQTVYNNFKYLHL